MKLIAEYLDTDLEIVSEANASGGKNLFIEGTFMESDQKNQNGRVYPKPILEAAVRKYITDMVMTKRAVGELNHPEGPSINLDKVSHIIESLSWQGNNVVGKARVLSTPMGDIVRGLLEGGVRLGVSTRGMGSLVQTEGTMIVQSDFTLRAVDVVQDPSAPTAFVNGILEGVDWVWKNGIVQRQVIEKMETEIRRASRADGPKVQLREFNNFLSALKI